MEREGLEKLHLLPLPNLQFNTMDTTRGRGRSPKLAKMMDGHGAGVRDAIKKSKDSTTPLNKATLSALMKYGFEPALPDALERCVYLF